MRWCADCPPATLPTMPRAILYAVAACALVLASSLAGGRRRPCRTPVINRLPEPAFYLTAMTDGVKLIAMEKLSARAPFLGTTMAVMWLWRLTACAK